MELFTILQKFRTVFHWVVQDWKDLNDKALSSRSLIYLCFHFLICMFLLVFLTNCVSEMKMLEKIEAVLYAQLYYYISKCIRYVHVYFLDYLAWLHKYSSFHCNVPVCFHVSQKLLRSCSRSFKSKAFQCTWVHVTINKTKRLNWCTLPLIPIELYYSVVSILPEPQHVFF